MDNLALQPRDSIKREILLIANWLHTNFTCLRDFQTVETFIIRSFKEPEWVEVMVQFHNNNPNIPPTRKSKGKSATRHLAPQPRQTCPIPPRVSNLPTVAWASLPRVLKTQTIRAHSSNRWCLWCNNFRRGKSLSTKTAADPILMQQAVVWDHKDYLLHKTSHMR